MLFGISDAFGGLLSNPVSKRSFYQCDNFLFLLRLLFDTCLLLHFVASVYYQFSKDEFIKTKLVFSQQKVGWSNVSRRRSLAWAFNGGCAMMDRATHVAITRPAWRQSGRVRPRANRSGKTRVWPRHSIDYQLPEGKSANMQTEKAMSCFGLTNEDEWSGLDNKRTWAKSDEMHQATRTNQSVTRQPI